MFTYNNVVPSINTSQNKWLLLLALGLCFVVGASASGVDEPAPAEFSIDLCINRCDKNPYWRKTGEGDFVQCPVCNTRGQWTLGDANWPQWKGPGAKPEFLPVCKRCKNDRFVSTWKSSAIPVPADIDTDDIKYNHYVLKLDDRSRSGRRNGGWTPVEDTTDCYHHEIDRANPLSIKYYKGFKISRMRKDKGMRKVITKPEVYTYSLVRTPRVLGALLKEIEASY